jgi:CheY-like chemotaxis protein
MPLIVLMEDDAATRMLVTSVLKKDGYDVLSADNGAEGLDLVRLHKPDLVISDIQMPVMDGFAMLQVLRADAQLAETPVILLTSLQERAHMRIGMTSGADDYITKPFRPGELREATTAQIKRRETRAAAQASAVNAAVVWALEEQNQYFSQLYENRLASELSERWPSSDGADSDEKFDNASVLFVDIPPYAGLAEQLSSSELTEVVKKFYGSAGDTVHLFGARHMQFVGEGLLAIFAGTSDTHSVNHGLRAARAAVGLVESGRVVNQYLRSHFPGRNLPLFHVTVALHSGPVTLTVLQDLLRGNTAQLLPVGDAVTLTMLLYKQAHQLQWSVTASATMLRSVVGAVKVGRRTLVQIAGRKMPVDAVEIIGLV